MGCLDNRGLGNTGVVDLRIYRYSFYLVLPVVSLRVDLVTLRLPLLLL